MAPKTLVLAAVLLVAVVAAGQVPRCAGLGASSTNASVVISGVVPCSTGNNINVATAPAPFPNAAVQLLCNGRAMAGATADGNGNFVINMPGASKVLLTAIMGNQCNLVVSTPLAACDASLAGVTGTQTSPLKLLGITSTGSGGGLDLGGIIGLILQIISGVLGGILTLAPEAFSLV
ncbi:phylloplanin-like [Panicum miliaceum]|uniref:Phylloplanin-like n=1 Tax=Panicum miliaceum TaxID=4540 RepID=A0A3L6TLL8_PANMI|nr:phylloplanin-like [Panicum miliaceum]